jgi:hypothetical protein
METTMRQPVSDIEKLVAVNEIREVMARYARHADHKEFEALAALFTPDGTFTPHKVDGSVWMHMELQDHPLGAASGDRRGCRIRGRNARPGIQGVRCPFGESTVEFPSARRRDWRAHIL